VYRIFGEIFCLHFREHEKLGVRGLPVPSSPQPCASPTRRGERPLSCRRVDLLGIAAQSHVKFRDAGRTIHVILPGQALLCRT
jgi:hypothetical protein